MKHISELIMFLDISWLPDARAVWAIAGGVIVLLLTQYLRRNDPIKNKIAEDAYQAIKLLDKDLTELEMAIQQRSISEKYEPVKYRDISLEIRRFTGMNTRLILGGGFIDNFVPLRYLENLHLPPKIKAILKKFKLSKIELTEDAYKKDNDCLLFVGNGWGVDGIGEGEAYKSVKNFISTLEELQKAIDKWIAKYK